MPGDDPRGTPIMLRSGRLIGYWTAELRPEQRGGLEFTTLDAPAGAAATDPPVEPATRRHRLEWDPQWRCLWSDDEACLGLAEVVRAGGAADAG